MNISGLLPWQPAHAKQLLAALWRYGAALDASDTGTGKTYAALAVCRELKIVPLVIGPKNGRATWERAAKQMEVEIEYANYEKVRGRRMLRGGMQVDTLRLIENRGDLFDTPVSVVGLRGGKVVFNKRCTHSDATDYVNIGRSANEQKFDFETEFGEYVFKQPFFVGQENTSESEWIVEKKYGSGSFVQFKNSYAAIFFDEVHRCSGSKSLQSKLLIAAKRSAKFVVGISATVADDPQQMKALGYALGLHQLNGKFGFRPWLLRHGCTLDKETNRITISYDTNRQSTAFASLHKELFPSRGARMRKSEIPDFPHSKLDIKLLTAEGKADKLVGELHDLHEQYKEQATQTGSWVHAAQQLELLMVPDVVELAEDAVAEARVAIFCNYQATREALTEALQKKFGFDRVGFVDGTQVGASGERQRRNFIDRYQENQLAAIVLNAGAGGENISLHDPTGKVEREAFIFPQDSARRLKQILGRVDRAQGANSLQWLLYFNVPQHEKAAARVLQRMTNLELLNDGDSLL